MSLNTRWKAGIAAETGIEGGAQQIVAGAVLGDESLEPDAVPPLNEAAGRVLDQEAAEIRRRHASLLGELRQRHRSTALTQQQQRARDGRMHWAPGSRRRVAARPPRPHGEIDDAGVVHGRLVGILGHLAQQPVEIHQFVPGQEARGPRPRREILDPAHVDEVRPNAHDPHFEMRSAHQPMPLSRHEPDQRAWLQHIVLIVQGEAARPPDHEVELELGMAMIDVEPCPRHRPAYLANEPRRDIPGPFRDGQHSHRELQKTITAPVSGDKPSLGGLPTSLEAAKERRRSEDR